LNHSDLPITQFLRDWKEGDPESAGRVVSGLYSELHRMAERLLRSERPSHTLQPTALINEVYLRLGGANAPKWRSRAHFFAVVATTLRRILIDHARTHCSTRRGRGEMTLPLDETEVGAACSYDDLLIIDEALCELERADPRAARVTELRFFAGLLESEIAEELAVSEITVKRDWKFARAWLAAHLKSR
jgi:RNA polymerase sigma factor (TIGR02999 family)